MRRAEAMKLVRQRVSAWTAMNGVYVGELVEVHGSPWRARVRVQEVLAWPTPTNTGAGARDATMARRPFHEGFILDVGGSSCSPHAAPRRSYLESAEAAAADLIRIIDRERQHPRGAAVLQDWPPLIRAALDKIRAGNYCHCRCHDHPAPEKYRAAFTHGDPTKTCCNDMPRSVPT